MRRSMFVLSFAAAMACAAPSAHADDEAPAPKKVRIKLKKHDADGHASERTRASKQAQPRSPMPTIERWLRGKLGGSAVAPTHDPMASMLKQWFEGGDDVPMADLRDALTADGWDANSMQAWMLGEMARSASSMHAMPFFSSRTFGPYLSEPRAELWRGRRAMGQGPIGHGGHGQGWHGHGYPPHAHPGHAHPRQGGYGVAPRGWRLRGGRAFRRGPRWRMRQGAGPMPGWPAPHGHAHGERAQGNRPHGGRPDARTPRVQRQQRAFILWNDGNGWQRRELPGGLNEAFQERQPFPMPHVHGHGTPQPPVAPRPPMPPVRPRADDGQVKVFGPEGEAMTIQGMEQIKALLEQLQRGGLTPGDTSKARDAARSAAEATKELESVLEMLKQLGVPIKKGLEREGAIVEEKILEEKRGR